MTSPRPATSGPRPGADSDVDAFLAEPLVAGVATVWRGEPRVRPVWFLYEADAFWWLTGSWSVLAREPAAEVFDDPSTTFVRLRPTRLRARDLSW